MPGAAFAASGGRRSSRGGGPGGPPPRVAPTRTPPAVPPVAPTFRALAGVLAPVATPFRADEAIDLDAFGANVRAHLEAGLHGVVVAGSTGEAALLDDEERVRLVAMARALVPDERWLVAGTGGESTRQTVRRCRQAAAEGADAVLVVAPHYYTAAMTTDALRAHYARVADESPAPVLLYNMPKYMHFSLDPALVAELARHENVVGMKDSSGDAALLGRYQESQGPAFTVLTGSGGGLHGALHGGSPGAILAVALFAPALALEVLHRWRAGDAAGSAAAQERLGALARDVVGALGVPGVKAALERVGLRGGPVRSPLRPLDDDQRARVHAAVDAALAAPAGAAR